MPFIPLDQNNKDISIGMWKVEEDESFFHSRLNIYENEKEILARITHPHKRLEWLSSRLCLKELLKITHKVESLNENTGKPYLSDNSFNISYSHSNLYSGAIASNKISVAMDLEDLSKQRNDRTRFLFMQPEELEWFDQLGDRKLFFLIWSSKETLYKIYGNRGLVFKENLLIRSDSPHRLEEEGTVSGILDLNGTRNLYEIFYKFFPGILLTYTVGPAFVQPIPGLASNSGVGRGARL